MMASQTYVAVKATIGHLSIQIAILLLVQEGSCQRTCNVNNCVPNLCDQDLCRGCLDGFYPVSNSSCSGCGRNCVTCYNSTSCTTCKAGYYGPYCQYRCSGCIDDLCNTDDGKCQTGCKDGFFFSFWYGYCNSCPPGCTRCTSYRECQLCNIGYWGKTCQYLCTNCKNNNCSRYGGCENGCKTGYFGLVRETGILCHSCPTECVACINASQCSVCRPGFNGTQCQFNCQSCNAQLCSGENGVCTIVCKPQQYFHEPDLECKYCPDRCTSCSSSTHCSSCIIGRWGQSCENSCDNCKDKLCHKDNWFCTSGCIDGYYGNTCTSLCPSSCQKCSSGTTCDVCKEPYFWQDNSNKLCQCRTDYCSSFVSEICQSCSLHDWFPKYKGCCPCSTSCLNASCNDDGTCRECKPGKYGATCEQFCSLDCLNNECHNNGTCVSCKENRYGPICSYLCSRTINYCQRCSGEIYYALTCTRCYENSNKYADGRQCRDCSSHCKPISYQSCNPETGSCLDGCEGGWFGDKCDSRCNVSNCESCSSNDSNVCAECLHGFYLKRNDSCYECSSYCRNDTGCNNYSGACEGGCNDGFSGKYCDVPCPSGCIQCNQFNRLSCSLCKEDHYGDSCELSHSKGFEGREATVNASFSKGLGIGLGVAGVLAIVCVVLVVILLRQRIGNVADDRQLHVVDALTTRISQEDNTPTVYYQNLPDDVIVAPRDLKTNNAARVDTGGAISDYQVLNHETLDQHDYSTLR